MGGCSALDEARKEHSAKITKQEEDNVTSLIVPATTGSAAVASASASPIAKSKTYLPPVSTVILVIPVTALGTNTEDTSSVPISGTGGITVDTGSATVSGIAIGISSEKLGVVEITVKITSKTMGKKYVVSGSVTIGHPALTFAPRDLVPASSSFTVCCSLKDIKTLTIITVTLSVTGSYVIYTPAFFMLGFSVAVGTSNVDSGTATSPGVSALTFATSAGHPVLSVVGKCHHHTL